MAEGDTLINAAIGAVATAVLSGFVPFAPLFGGAVSGYLEGGDRTAGLRVGVISGAIGLVLSAALFGVFFLFFVVFLAGSGAPRAIGAFGFLAFLGVLFTAVYMVGLSAVGGWLGNYVKYDTDIGS